MGIEETLIRNIENDIRSLRLKTKTLNELTVYSRLERLKKINSGMAEELEISLFKVLEVRDKNLIKKTSR
jgi:hypothetical protein